jgi:polyisoprenoid-binding protein YceI
MRNNKLGSGLTFPRRARGALLIMAASALVARRTAAQSVADTPSAVLRSGTLSFDGHATIGDFVGSTTTMSGAFTGDVAGARGWVEAPVATLQTKNDHRDRDLRGSMEVAKYPTMRFDLERVEARSTAPDGHADVLLHGSLTIHGVKRDVALPAIVARDGDTTHVTSTFPLDLTDYRIGGLTKMLGMLRMKPKIEVHVDLRFVDGPPPLPTSRGTS